MDVIALVETNINDEENFTYNLPKFQKIFFNRQGKRGRALALFIKDTWSIDVENKNCDTFECMVANISKPGSSFTIMNIYRPPSFLAIPKFIEQLENIIKTYDQH